MKAARVFAITGLLSSYPLSYLMSSMRFWLWALTLWFPKLVLASRGSLVIPFSIVNECAGNVPEQSLNECSFERAINPCWSGSEPQSFSTPQPITAASCFAFFQNGDVCVGVFPEP